MLEISRKNGSNAQSGSQLSPASKQSASKECQTEDALLSSLQARDNSSPSSSSNSTSSDPTPSAESSSSPPSSAATGTTLAATSSSSGETPAKTKSPVRANLITNSISPCFNHAEDDDEEEEDEDSEEHTGMNGSLSSSTNTVHQLSLLGSEGEEESSGDDEVTFNTIKRTPSGVAVNNLANAAANAVVVDVTNGGGGVKVNGNGLSRIIPDAENNGEGRLDGGKSSTDTSSPSASNDQVIVNNEHTVDDNSEFKENGPVNQGSRSAIIEDKDLPTAKKEAVALSPS